MSNPSLSEECKRNLSFMESARTSHTFNLAYGVSYYLRYGKCFDMSCKHNSMDKIFKSMMHNDMTVGAFSHSTAVGKLRKDLPDVPTDACTNFARYNLDEAATSCHYYARLSSPFICYMTIGQQPMAGFEDFDYDLRMETEI
ncbi:hypothetical protein CsSME_00049424 [Camellia sinensis var. sinensis]